jgi:hypothetical protein
MAQHGWWRWVFNVLVFAVALLTCASIRAEVTVSTPAGWQTSGQVPQAALAEADGWASATQLEVSHVSAPDHSENPEEILVVLRDSRPLHPRLFEDADAASETLADLVSNIFDASGAPEAEAIVDVGDARVITAQWIIEGMRWDVALVPAGAEHALLVMRTRASESSLYRGLFDDLVSGLEGVMAPVAPFPRTTWRWLTIGILLSLALVAHLVWLGLSDQYRDHLGASRRAASTTIVLSVVGAGTIYALLGDQEVALELANSSRTGLAIETLVVGLAAGGLLTVVGRRIGSGQGRVDSAPKTGAFSGEAAPAAPSQGSGSNPVPKPLGPEADADVGDFHRSSDDNPILELPKD